MDVLGLEDLKGEGRRHVGISVPVASNPCAEMEGFCGCGHLNAEACELMLQLVVDLRYGRSEQATEEVDDGAGFIGWRWPFDSEFICLPHGVDEFSDTTVDPIPVRLPRRSSPASIQE